MPRLHVPTDNGSGFQGRFTAALAPGAAVSGETLAAVSGGAGIPGAAIPCNVLGGGPCDALPLPDGRPRPSRVPPWGNSGV